MQLTNFPGSTIDSEFQLPLSRIENSLLEINLLSRDAIDKKRWDNHIIAYGLGMPYARFEYLDIATGKQWEALVSNDYQYVYPLPFEYKLGLKFYAQPMLCQQLGLIGPEPNEQLHSTFLNQIPSNYGSYNLKCNEKNTLGSTTFLIEHRTNFVLDLNLDYSALSQKFSKSLRKRIRQSTAYYQLQIVQDIDMVVTFYQNEMEKRLRLGSEKYELIANILQWLQSKKLGICYAAFNKNNQIEAMLFVGESSKRIINLFGASNNEGRNNFAMHFILNEVIKKFSDRDMIFDFEGSDIPGVSSFYQSFGSTNRSYPQLIKEQLPFWFKMLRSINGILKR